MTGQSRVLSRKFVGASVSQVVPLDWLVPSPNVAELTAAPQCRCRTEARGVARNCVEAAYSVRGADRVLVLQPHFVR